MRYSWTNCSLVSKVSIRQQASSARARIFAVVLILLARVDSPTVFFIWKPKIVAVSWYEMLIIKMDLSQDPNAIAFDFWTFTLAPDSASKQCIASYSFFISVEVVTKIVTSSAYATTEVLARFHPIRRPRRVLSRVQRCGFQHIGYRIMVKGLPCGMELLNGKVQYLKPFICTDYFELF